MKLIPYRLTFSPETRTATQRHVTRCPPRIHVHTCWYGLLSPDALQSQNKTKKELKNSREGN